MSPPAASPGRPELLATLHAGIAAHGPMTFARFMELALYHPRWGYYTAPGAPERIGRGGDFFTNVSVGAVFGELLAVQFAGMWEAMGRPAAFALVELGARRGRLVADVRAWAERERPDFNRALRVTALDYPGELPEAVTGCIFSNEMVDALPVHRVTRRGGEWLELFVVSRNNGFSFEAHPFSSKALREEAARLPLPDTDGFTTEVHLEARRWMTRVSRCLQRGFVLTIDYGYAAADYYAPHRKDGTLMCYHRHRAGHDPLVRVGEQDMTAHVNFTALAETASAEGVPPLGFCDQSQFIGALVGNNAASGACPSDAKRLAQLKTLLHPELMGQTFKVLVQYRGMEGATLAGLKFARRKISQGSIASFAWRGLQSKAPFFHA
jgi:SAM-dependent MidA family methyltransferase